MLVTGRTNTPQGTSSRLSVQYPGHGARCQENTSRTGIRKSSATKSNTAQSSAPVSARRQCVLAAKSTRVSLPLFTSSLDTKALTPGAVWDAKPETPGQPINWVELKTSAEMHTHNHRLAFDRKLMKYWIQSFLLGVPKIIVGFRSQDGILGRVEEFQTMTIPDDVQRRGTARWDGKVCIKFTSLFLDCKILCLLVSPVSRLHNRL